MRSKRSKGVADPEYMAWIRTLDCLIPGCRAFGGVEAHHAGVRGLSQKSDDRTCVPLCHVHHRTGVASAHRLRKKFWDFHALDRERVIQELHERYEMEKAA